MKRYKWPALQPQPQTPVQGPVTPFGFDSYRRARNAKDGQFLPYAIRKLYRSKGAYRVKPKRGSRGVIWKNCSFYWSEKGYYRPGKWNGHRRPLQHLLWESYHHRQIPRGSEVFFKDRDRHNFTRGNLELLTKAELHKRVHLLGETRGAKFAIASCGRQLMNTRKSRNLVDILLSNSQTHKTKDSHDSLRFLAGRRQKIINDRAQEPRD